MIKVYKPHSFQKEFHNSDVRFRSLIAGRRGGKSLAGTIETLRQLDKRPNVHGMVIAPTYTMLKDVNIPLFMEWCPPQAIKSYNKAELKLELVNGSMVLFRSGDNPDRLRGVGLDFVWPDEACFMDKEVWETIYPGLTDRNGIAWVTTTPQGYDWVYKTFYKPAIEGNPDFAAWRYTTEDNPYIDRVLIEKAKQDLSEVMFRQEYMATFEKFEGMVYPDFTEEIHVKNPPEKNIRDIFFVGIDVGWNHPTAILLAKEDLDHNIYILDEIREQFLTAKDISNNLNSLLVRNDLKKDDVASYIIDPASKSTQQTSGVSMYDQLAEEGWGFVPATNEVMAGINRVTRLLRENKLFISKRCKMLKDEIMSYHWHKWKENVDVERTKPFKLGDDLIDVLRYLAMSRPDWFEHPELDMYSRVVEPDSMLALDRAEDDTIDYIGESESDFDDGSSLY